MQLIPYAQDIAPEDIEAVVGVPGGEWLTQARLSSSSNRRPGTSSYSKWTPRAVAHPKTDFKQLVAEMVREDLKSAERDELVKKHGYPAYDYHE